MFNLRKIQRDQWIWSQKNFPDNKKWMPLMGIGEEVGELMHHFLKSAQNIRNQEEHYIEMIDAVGDITIYLMNFCSEMGIDLENAIVETWQNVKERDWQKNPDTAHMGNNLIDNIKMAQVRTGKQMVMNNLNQLRLQEKKDKQ